MLILAQMKGSFFSHLPATHPSLPKNVVRAGKNSIKKNDVESFKPLSFGYAQIACFCFSLTMYALYFYYQKSKFPPQFVWPRANGSGDAWHIARLQHSFPLNFGPCNAAHGKVTACGHVHISIFSIFLGFHCFVYCCGIIIGIYCAIKYIQKALWAEDKLQGERVGGFSATSTVSQKRGKVFAEQMWLIPVHGPHCCIAHLTLPYPPVRKGRRARCKGELTDVLLTICN